MCVSLLESSLPDEGLSEGESEFWEVGVLSDGSLEDGFSFASLLACHVAFCGIEDGGDGFVRFCARTGGALRF